MIARAWKPFVFPGARLMAPPNWNDVLGMDWLARQTCVTIEHAPVHPNGFGNDTPWSISFPGKVPFVGKTLQAVIDGAMEWERLKKEYADETSQQG